MQDHGARTIIPLNILMMCGCAMVSLFGLPWWTTVMIVLGLLAIRNFATDQYGGMQISAFLLPGLLAGLLTLARRLQDAGEDELPIPFWEATLQFIAMLILFPIALVLWMLAVVGVILAWEWLSERVRARSK